MKAMKIAGLRREEYLCDKEDGAVMYIPSNEGRIAQRERQRWFAGFCRGTKKDGHREMKR